MSSLVPEQWDFCPIGNHIEVLTDYTANGSFSSLKENVQYFNEKSYAALVRTTDLEKDTFRPQRFTDKKGYEFLKKSSLTHGDIVIANVGSAGKAYRVPDANMPMTLAPNMYLVKFCKSMDSDFAFQVITNERFYSDLMSNVGSSTLNAINKSNFRSINIFVPPLPEQKKITSILTSVDEVIEKTQLQINKLQDLKKGTMNELLTRGIGHKEFKDSELGRIPEDWSSVCLGDYAYIKARIGWRGLSSSEYTVSGPYLIAGKHIKGSGVDWLNCDHINDFRYEESREIQLQENDIIISKDGTIGRLAFIEYLPGKATINGTMMLIRTEKNFHSKYVYFYLQGDNFQKLIREKVSGSSIPHIFQRDMITFNLPMPPLTEQKKIVSILTPIDKTIEDKQCKLTKIKSLKKSLMQDLLTGKVRVTVN
jgi:type I restriction enzyme, S subunit